MSSPFCRNHLFGVAAWLAVIAVGAAGIGVGASLDTRGPRELLDEAGRAYEARQVDRAETLFRDALKLAESENLARDRAEALLGLGRIELEGDRRTAAKGSLERAVTLFETAGDTIGHAQALAASGQARVLLGDAAAGVRLVQTAVDTLRARGAAARGDESRGDAAREDVEALARASAILMSVMPPGPGKDSARDAAFAAARASSARGHECAIRHAWGGDLLRAGDYAEAWRVLTGAVACYEAVPNDRRLTNALISIGSLKRTHGQFDAELVAFERAVTVSRERNDAELNLDADLVVLSACSSALGPTGTEGVIGFTRAFLYAGAASVIATSWNVPDASSYELMRRFYRARRDTPATARALRAAQLSTLAALRQGKVTVTTPGDLNGRGTTVALLDHPLFWAGFIVVGEP